MKKFRSHIALVFLGLAMGGMMLSMLHYHSDGLECLTHASEEHYAENELVCPVAGIIAVYGTEAQPSVDAFFQSNDILLDFSPLYLSTDIFVSLLGRAPPFLA
ncbi:hypothetical protein [Gracilimonas sp.]|uniref:hypothetical protein n=1 Tax=Gracilimonas sp. TaxID=1974203 RepID=UPI002870CC26|nr:hypothetical protein [Gracilimonas sp.]